jgi:hypothetical protein
VKYLTVVDRARFWPVVPEPTATNISLPSNPQNLQQTDEASPFLLKVTTSRPRLSFEMVLFFASAP